MAEQRPGGQPTEAPTPKRLRDARKRGEVARSVEVVSAAVFVAGAVVVLFAGSTLWTGSGEYLRASLGLAVGGADVLPSAVLERGLWTGLALIGPVLLVVAVAAAGANLAQIGALFSLQAIKPKLAKINPIENAKNIFGKRALVELAKSLLKVGGIGYVAGITVWDFAPRLLALASGRAQDAVTVVGQCLRATALRVAAVAVALAVLDLLYQRWSFTRRMRMTKEEVKREHKESEGDPQHKAERQRVHREILEHQMVERTAIADCVVVNPKHIAVALRYDQEDMDAPQVVARGRGLLASRIRQVARRHGIPIVRNVPLAHALVELELDDEIPAGLYDAVAEVLRFVYGLSARQAQGPAPEE